MNILLVVTNTQRKSIGFLTDSLKTLTLPNKRGKQIAGEFYIYAKKWL